ncbi:MAG TPA: Era-like GTP-binding protein [Candidatus Thermoplasmatota archaeon]|nr:Era-like GTP-binding protein [Candidatus Thermoplasmatota archaeon]
MSSSLARWFGGLFGRRAHARIGIYGPPNAGKTTLANRISRDFTGETVGTASSVPHETRRVREKKDIDLKANGHRLHIDVVDTPGIATQIDFHEFVEDHHMDEGEARRRAKEATEGVIEAIRWLEDVDGVLLVMDAAEDPFTQVNVTILGNLEARRLPVIIIANKIDLPEASPATIKAAFPQHPVVPVSAGEGTNMDALYEAITKHFG